MTFAEGSPELEYMRARRMELGGYLPARRQKAEPLPVPPLSAFERFLKSTDDREISTTMAFVQILQHPAARQEPRQAHRADRSRRIAHLRHGRACSASSASGTSRASSTRREDADQLMFYKETKDGQILQEGINEAGGDVRLDRRRDVVLDARRADDPLLHLLLDVRLPARRRSRLGRRRHALRAASCWAAPPGARR